MELKDKIRGAVVGLAYGDALGLGAEFMTQHEVESYYPEGLRHFDQIIRDAHRSQYKRGEVSNETILTLLMLKCVIDNKGFYTKKLCENFQDWYAKEHRDMPPYLRLYCTNKEWPDNPIQVAHHLWHTSGLAEASNETLHRGVVAGLASPDDLVKEHTRKLVLMTHDDSRCVASAIVIATVTHATLKDREVNIEDLLRLCNVNDPRTLPFLRKAWEGDIAWIGVDDPDTQLWTRKSMAAALWGFWHHNNAADTIHSVIDLGGDANTNAALAGVLAGLKYGYEALPEEKTKIKGHDKLIDFADRLTEYLSNNEKL